MRLSHLFALETARRIRTNVFRVSRWGSRYSSIFAFLLSNICRSLLMSPSQFFLFFLVHVAFTNFFLYLLFMSLFTTFCSFSVQCYSKHLAFVFVNLTSPLNVVHFTLERTMRYGCRRFTLPHLQQSLKKKCFKKRIFASSSDKFSQRLVTCPKKAGPVLLN